VGYQVPGSGVAGCSSVSEGSDAKCDGRLGHLVSGFGRKGQARFGEDVEPK